MDVKRKFSFTEALTYMKNMPNTVMACKESGFSPKLYKHDKEKFLCWNDFSREWEECIFPTFVQKNDWFFSEKKSIDLSNLNKHVNYDTSIAFTINKIGDDFFMQTIMIPRQTFFKDPVSIVKMINLNSIEGFISQASSEFKDVFTETNQGIV